MCTRQNDRNHDKGSHIKSQYDSIAHKFSRTRANQWSSVSNFMHSVPENSWVYDIGCGNGRHMRGNYQFVGLDNCINFVDICLQNGLSVFYGDMCRMIRFPNDCAEYILCIAAFHHIDTHNKRIKALKEMKRILKPGGKMLLTVWSILQPSKTKRTFNYFGDTVVPFNDSGKITKRYYYIFQIDYLVSLFLMCGFKILNHYWDCGNEVFILY
jgi:SAM-dependent methyltransferase